MHHIHIQKIAQGLLVCLLAWAGHAWGQASYSIDFEMGKDIVGRYYMTQHFRDAYIYLDSGVAYKGRVVFQSLRQPLPRGLYTLLDGSRKPVADFVVDDATHFSYALDSARSHKGMRVRGSKANARMHAYLARQDQANEEAKALRKQQQEGNNKEKQHAKEELLALGEEMAQYEAKYFSDNTNDYFAQVVRMTRMPDPPKSLTRDEDKLYYVRQHYWDSVDFSFPNLARTAQLFNKMNYYFFGLLYYEESDTITLYANRVLARVEDDSAMLRYFLDFICPRYQKSTKHIGWDQVYVDLVKDYYVRGKCPWATEAELYNKRQEVDFLEQSLIGAHGTELWMADTNQSPNPKDWISSHRFPTKYVILWFWDPDCSHCQTQTQELKELYNTMAATGRKRFEVYAVGYESDVAKWKKYVREHQLPWVNVGGTNVNIDYQSAYNVHGAPSMVILDERRNIIMNKTLPVSQLMEFLDRHEARQAQNKE